ncbi:hypothetical protein WI75_25435 [Burkholderia ubonensis]|nr:hypothetical protein WI75_25435 [Burkholderia ubonensis]
MNQDLKYGEALARSMLLSEVESIGRYTKCRSNEINTFLRTGLVQAHDSTRGLITDIDMLERALAKMPKSSGTVFRAVPDAGISAALATGVLKIGDTVGDPAFLSTTSSVDALKSQQFYQMPRAVVVYEIESTRGTPLPFKPFTEVAIPQCEVIFPRDCRFQISAFASFKEPDQCRGERQVTYVKVTHLQKFDVGDVRGMCDGEKLDVFEPVLVPARKVTTTVEKQVSTLQTFEATVPSRRLILKDMPADSAAMNEVASQPGSEQNQDGAEARAQQLAQPLNQVAQKLQRIAADADTGARFQQLDAMSRKNRYGQFDLNQQVLGRMSYASSNWERQLGVELNVSYLRLLQAMVQDAGPLVAEKAARLLRSPDNGKLTFAKLAGYYRSVLEHGRHNPELIDALKMLLDNIDQQARPSTIAKLTAKVQKQLEQVLKSGAAPTRQATGFAEIQQQLESIRSRCMDLAGRQAADEARQQAHDQQQKQRATELQVVLTQHGLVVPSYMRDSLGDSHVALARTIQADVERRRGQLRETSRTSLEASLRHLRSMANGYRVSISANQAELEKLRTQADQSGKSALKQALNVAKKALSAAQSAAERLSEDNGRELDAGIHELDRDARNRLLDQFLDAGVYLENPAEEKAALQRCLQSDAAKRIVSKAVEESKDFLGQVVTDKAIELASKRLAENVMGDRFFREKMAKIKQGFANQVMASAEASEISASGPTLAKAHAEAGSEAKRRVMEQTQSQVKQQAKAAVEEQAHRQAQASAREQADRAARKQAIQAARQEAVSAAREQAERDAREQAEQAARQEVVSAAREQAERDAREQAVQAARQEAVSAAREQAERDAREQAVQAARQEAERTAREEAERAAAETAAKAIEERLRHLRQPAREISNEQFLDHWLERRLDEKSKLVEQAPNPPSAAPGHLVRVRQAEAELAEGRHSVV